MFEIGQLLFWGAILAYVMYGRLKKPAKTWRDYADMGLIVIFFMLMAFITFITSLR